MFVSLVILQMMMALFQDQVDCSVPEGTELPDMVTVVPQQISIQNKEQREWLRFSNNLANVGGGSLWVEPALDPDPNASELPAYQVFHDGTHVPIDAVPPASGVEGFLGRCEIGKFAFHPEHNHWHIAEVADYRICKEEDFDVANPGGCTATGDTAEKVTFCLIDWTKLGDNSPTSDDTRSFWDCYTSFQGVSPGWGDQYHHSLEGQGIDITTAEDGIYYLVSTVNPNNIFFEDDYGNNSSWVQFHLGPAGNGGGNGNRKVTIIRTACDDANFLHDVEEDVDAYRCSSGTDVSREDLIDALCNGVNANR